MCFGTDLKCPICGAVVFQNSKGRTKEYCSDSCRLFNKYFNAMEKALLDVDFKDSKSARTIKSQLWRVSNIVVIKKE